MKKWLSLVLALAMTLSLSVTAFAAPNSLDNFVTTATYNGQFKDVPANHWAAESVKTCYEYGLMKGADKGFNPKGTLTVAEALVMADRVHEIFTTGKSTLTNGSPWYQPYVDYALENGIVKKGDFASYTAKVTRAEMAYIFYHALPETALPAINEIEKLPDVTASTAYSRELLGLYQAGVLTGSDPYGTANPTKTITRAEAAAIIARVALADQRQHVLLLEDVVAGDYVVIAKPTFVRLYPQIDPVVFSLNGISGETVVMASVMFDKNSMYRGQSVRMVPVETIEKIILSSTNCLIHDLKTTDVTFGNVEAYCTTAIAEDAGKLLYCVMFTYIVGDQMQTVTEISSDETLLKSMANNLRVGGSTASPSCDLRRSLRKLR